jgi:secreted PhoX family phosphatase
VRFPQGTAFDSSGNLWVADSSNSRVLEYTTPLTTGKAASVVLGQSDFTHRSVNQGGGSTPSATSLAVPQGIAFDSTGNLWVADSSNNRTLEYKAPLNTNKAASIVLGQSDFTTGTSGLSQNKLNLRLVVFNGPTFDSSGNLWIADENNHRILEFLVGSSPSIPEFPLGGVVLMFAVSGAAYAAIRYRATRISSL